MAAADFSSVPGGGSRTYPLTNLPSGNNYPSEPYLGNGGPGSNLDMLKAAYGPSVMATAMPEGRMVSPHTSLYATSNQTLYIDMPDVNTTTYIAAEMLLSSLLQVVNRVNVTVDVEHIVAREVVFDVLRYVPAAPFVHGPTAGAQSREQTFSMHRFVLGAEIEDIVKSYTQGGAMIWDRFMAGMINALRFTWTDLIFTAYFSYAARPTMGPSGAPGRNWVEVAEMWAQMVFAGSKSQSGLTTFALNVGNEKKARGLQAGFSHILVSSTTAMRSNATLTGAISELTTPSVSIKNYTESVPTNITAGETSRLAAVLGLKVIKIDETVKNNLPHNPLEQRVMTMQHVHAHWRDQLATELDMLPGGDDEKKIYFQNAGFELHDWCNGVVSFKSLWDLYSNIAVNTVDPDDVGNEVAVPLAAAGAALDDDAIFARINAYDLELLRPYIYMGEVEVVTVKGSVTLSTTQPINKEGANVFSKKLDLQSVVFAVAFATNPDQIMVCPPMYPTRRVAGGSTEFITRQQLDEIQHDLSGLKTTHGLIVVAVPKFTEAQKTSPVPCSSIYGEVPDYLTREGPKITFGNNATVDALKLFWNGVVQNDADIFDPSHRNAVPLITYQDAHKLVRYQIEGDLAAVCGRDRKFYTKNTNGIHGYNFYEGCHYDLFQQNRPFVVAGLINGISLNA